MKKPFVGVDFAGQLEQPPHQYSVATRFSRKKQHKWIICLSRDRINELSIGCADWREKIYAILILKTVNKVFQPGCVIHIDKEFHGTTQKKVSNYLRRLFGVINYGKGIWANPPFEFLPKEYSAYVREADRKSKQARRKMMHSNETDPPIEKMLEILEDARRRGIV
ncbi:MAG: hypothetical protein AOA66_0346 [Candidatus Bathyarchaeota archaeon BA2]|nr:MAG: hypothetical protein AOA66_0346 [Candidatus Bathyarchaeota archaeon BA2]